MCHVRNIHVTLRYVVDMAGKAQPDSVDTASQRQPGHQGDGVGGVNDR